MNFKQQKPPKKEEVEKSVGRNSLEEVEPTVNGEEDGHDSDPMSDPPPQLRTGPSSDSSGPEESNKENKPVKKRGKIRSRVLLTHF